MRPLKGSALMQSQQEQSFSEVVGSALRYWRAQPPVRTQGQLAQEMRRRGFPWTEVTVAAVESGKREITAAELMVLCASFRVDVQSLFSDRDASVTVASSGARLHSQQMVESLLVGSDIEVEAPSADWRPLIDETTRKVARRNGLPPHTLDALAIGMWGRSLLDEREARVAGFYEPGAPRTLQAQRGHIMRKLLNELGVIVDA